MRNTLLLTATAILALPAAASAVVVPLQGNFINTAVGDNGTLGAGGGTKPGLQFDPTGMGNFNPNADFITPGIPFEGFNFQSDQSGVVGNNNSGVTFGFAETMATTDLSGTGFDNRAIWSGSNGQVSITIDTRFNDDQRSVEMFTTVTAIQDQTNAFFSRQIDPDPDSESGGTSNTRNFRGLDLNNDGDFDDDGEVGPSRLIGAEGQNVGQTIVLFTFESGIPVNTGIDASCCSFDTPVNVFGGGDFAGDTLADHGLGIAFSLGDLIAGQSISFSYFYGVAAEFDDIDIDPDPDPMDVPAPGALGLLGLGLAGIAAARRRRA